jgi:peptidyl-tRNA hydrolase, PTH2 family
MTKQIIVVRKDLHMGKGKLASQVAHASMKVFFDRGVWCNYEDGRASHYDIYGITPAMKEWMSYGPFVKIVVGVDTELELLQIQEKANKMCVPNALITDAGLTEFNGIPTNTCVAIGPDEVEKIDEITGKLKLL